MQPIYQQEFQITDAFVDCHGRLKSSMILYFAQEVAGNHFALLSMDYDSLARRGLFWAITRTKVQITRMPRQGETIRVETWPMPTTRVAYPRSMVAYDENGNEVFRSISLWVLMDLNSRSMILPDKSGISVVGTLRGTELDTPMGLIPKALNSSRPRTVAFSDLDRNGHMNNCRYLDWINDLLPSSFHARNTLKEFTLCYLMECREGQQTQIRWDFQEDGSMRCDVYRKGEEKDERVLAAKLLFE